MKAWLVNEKDEFEAAVVFAETRGKAKVLARSTGACEDASFIDIEAHRIPHMDKYYTEGKKEMDWFTLKDRIALITECGFYCEDATKEKCEDCLAKDYCDYYKDYIDEEGASDENL